MVLIIDRIEFLYNCGENSTQAGLLVWISLFLGRGKLSFQGNFAFTRKFLCLCEYSKELYMCIQVLLYFRK